MAVYATAGAAPGISGALRDTSMLYLPPAPPRVTVPRTATSPVIADVPPKGFQTVPVVLDIPNSIPAVDLGTPFNKDDWTGVGREGGRRDGAIVADTATVAPSAYLADAVDEAVVPILIPSPRFPPVLRAAGIRGEVVAQYVVDTMGLVERASWTVIRASHDGFREAAREAILAGRFSPARVSGRKVRQLVQQVIRFDLR
jgi:protein TonB